MSFTPTSSSIDSITTSSSSSEATHTTSINSLPPEILMKIFNMIPPDSASDSFRKFERVSHAWRVLVQNIKYQYCPKILRELTDSPQNFLSYLNKIRIDPVEHLSHLKWRLERRLGLIPANSNSELPPRIWDPAEQEMTKSDLAISQAVLDFYTGDTVSIFRSLFSRRRCITNEELAVTLLYSSYPRFGSNKIEIRRINLTETASSYIRNLPQELKKGESSFQRTRALGFEKLILKALQNGFTPSLADIDVLIETQQIPLLRTIREYAPNTFLNPWQWCAICGEVEELDMLPANETMINDVTDKGRTPLHFAAQRGDLNMINALIRKGANPNVAAEIRIDKSLDLYDGIKFKITPVTLAIVKGHTDCARRLIALTVLEENNLAYLKNNISGFDEEYTPISGQIPIPIYAAIIHEMIEVLTDLFAINVRGTRGFAFTEMIRIAGDNQCSVSFFNRLYSLGIHLGGNQLVILTAAVKANSLEVAEDLLLRGIDPNQLLMMTVRNTHESNLFFGKCSTATTHARTDEMVALLQSYGGVRYVETAYRIAYTALNILNAFIGIVAIYSLAGTTASLRNKHSIFAEIIGFVTDVAVIGSITLIFQFAIILGNGLLLSSHRWSNQRQRVGNFIARRLS